MEVITYKEFSKNLSRNLNKVIDNSEGIIVSLSNEKNIVIVNAAEYNSMNETLHLISSKWNQKRLDEAMEEMEKMDFPGNI